ncbi:MAG: MmgE/PrpD family protein [Clostridiales bacterium]|nr:MmgE/PrpD family protein [Clostridiales bacterium]
METTHRQTRELAAYITDMHYSTLSSHALDLTKMCVEDFLGVAIAGSIKKESTIWKTYYSQKVTAPEATLFQAGFDRCTTEQAASLNAVFGHVLDMDDVHNASITHLAAVTIPTAIALGQKLHKNGRDIITAIAAGYEVGARIGEAINPSSYQYWHTTGVIGAFSSGAAASKLLDLTADETVNCFGSAGTQAAGLWEFLASGSMSKVLHTANANLCGLRSAELAKLGFTGSPTILEGDRAFIKALAPEYNLDCLTKGFGKSLRIEENSFKPYACCRHTHSANYCIEKILAKHTLNPDEIESIIDDTYSTASQTANNPYPENPYAAKFSLQFCIAAAILFHDLSDRVFTLDNIHDSSVRNLMSKITIHVDKQLDDEFHRDPTQWPHRLSIRLKNGTILVEQVNMPIGDFKNPFDWEMADRKFRLLTQETLDRENSDLLLSRLHRLEELDDINKLF